MQYAILTGKLPKANTRLCHKCGQPAVVYVHPNGWDKEHVLDVQPACKACSVAMRRGRGKAARKLSEPSPLVALDRLWEAVQGLTGRSDWGELVEAHETARRHWRKGRMSDTGHFVKPDSNLSGYISPSPSNLPEGFGTNEPKMAPWMDALDAKREIDRLKANLQEAERNHVELVRQVAEAQAKAESYLQKLGIKDDAIFGLEAKLEQSIAEAEQERTSHRVATRTMIKVMSEALRLRNALSLWDRFDQLTNKKLIAEVFKNKEARKQSLQDLIDVRKAATTQTIMALADIPLVDAHVLADQKREAALKEVIALTEQPTSTIGASKLVMRIRQIGAIAREALKEVKHD